MQTSRRAQRGQAMAEFIIALAVLVPMYLAVSYLGRYGDLQQRGLGMTAYIVAVAAIGVYSIFGETVKNQTGAMAAALGGDNGDAKTHNDKAKTVNVDNAGKVSTTKSLSDFTKNNQLSN